MLQNLNNYGGSFFNPINKVAALIGMGPKAVIKLNVGTTTTGLCTLMLNFADIFACQTTNALHNTLPTPNENRLVNFKGLKMIVPAPFL